MQVRWEESGSRAHLQGLCCVSPAFFSASELGMETSAAYYKIGGQSMHVNKEDRFEGRFVRCV